MDTQLQQIALAEKMQTKVLALWEDQNSLNEIRKAYAKNATDTEFQMLIEMGKSTALNPFLKELWLVKYGTGPAQIFIGRDGYRIAAQRQPDYDYHLVDAVYSKDKFQMMNGEVQHQYQIGDRGLLIGAYCVVKRKSASRTMYVFVELKEYDLKQGLWKTKPATMIKKVAEAQAIRMAFQSTFAGSYAEEELPEHKSRIPEEKPKIDEGNVYDAFIAINTEQIDRIDNLVFITDMDIERLENGLNKYYKKTNIAELTYDEAEDFIKKLEKIAQAKLSKKTVLPVEAEPVDSEAIPGD